MANIIKLKYGSGTPGANALQTGEVGLDLINKVIYAGDADGNAIEMGRNMGEGGTIGWDQIDPDTIPPELNIIINGEIPEYVTLDALIAQVKANAEDIAALKAWETTAKAQISKLETDVAKNAGDILTNTGNITQNTTDIGKNAVAIKGNTDAIGVLDGRVTTNEGDIADIKAQINADLTGLNLAGTYDASINKIKTVKSSAAAAGFVENTSLSEYLGNAYAGFYFIVDEPGELASTGTPARADGEFANTGDWLVNDGPHWVHFEFGSADTTFSQIAGSPYDNDALGAELNAKMDKDAVISGGTYG